MKRIVPRTLRGLGMIIVLLGCSSPVLAYPQADVVNPEEETALANEELDSEGLVLPDRRANVRDRTPAELPRIISLDAAPAAAIELRSSGSRWKWLAIGAGTAGAFVAAYLVQGHTGVAVPPRPGGPLSPAPVPQPSPNTRPPEVRAGSFEADTRSATGDR